VKTLIGRKIGMTQVLQKDGVAVPVTLIEAGPCQVVQVKNTDSDGYDAVQLGFEVAKKANKAQIGHSKKTKVTPKIFREFKTADIEATEIGSSFHVDEFEVGDEVIISGTSKGKGFAGTVKRHNFKTGPKSHGSRNVRKPGSIGSMYPQNVYKGRKLPGQMGHQKVTVKNQKVAFIDLKNNLIGINGAIPGPRNGIVTIIGTGGGK